MTGRPAHRVTPWPTMRNAVVSVLRQQRPHTVYGFGEADVTEALIAIRRLQRELRVAVSFHAFVIHCLARAAAEHPAILTFRAGSRLITFGDADVATVIDKRFPGGVRVPAVYTVRAAQTKSLAAINWELREGIRSDQGEVESVRLRRFVTRLPAFLRDLIGRRMMRDPFLLKRFHGTIGLTNIQSGGFDRPFFGLPPNLYTYTLAIGSIAERVVLDKQGHPEARKVVCLAAGADHEVIDGMPLSRFAYRLTQLLESAAGLDDDFAAETRQQLAREPRREGETE